MDDDLIDSASLSLTRRSLLPGTGFFYPDSLDERRAEERTREAVAGAEVVVVADGDADGMGCVALIREVYDAAVDVATFEADIAERLAESPTATGRAEDDGDDGAADGDTVGEDDADADDSAVAFVGASPHSLSDALERVGEYMDADADVFVCDLCPDDYTGIADSLDRIVDRAGTVRWFDHHQWSEEVATAVREAGVDLVVGESDEECTTDVALRSLEYEFSEQFRELAAVTRDHDLWIKEDSRSDDLSDYSYWTDAEEYISVVGAYGADLPEPVEAYIEHRREEKEALIGKAVERAEIRTVGPWSVGITYGRCSQNEVAEALREQGADAAVVVKPAGSASIRGSESFERCHEVAALVDGGGHPRAAGCKPDIYGDMLDYANHWVSRGEACSRVILAAFERVAEQADAEAEEIKTEA